MPIEAQRQNSGHGAPNEKREADPMNAAENKQMSQQVLAEFTQGSLDTFLKALAEDAVLETPRNIY